jgi:PhoH-like ATPase
MPATRKAAASTETAALQAAADTSSRPRRAAARRSHKPRACKLFVLDTNVLMHDPTCLYRFEEHDLYVPIMTLEELDNNKKGTSEVARNARQASRMLDEIVSGSEDGIAAGIALEAPSRGLATGRLHLQTEAIEIKLPPALPTARGDNQILAVVMFLVDKHPGRDVILVSKDINMRVPSGSLRRTTSMTRCSRTPTCCTPAPANCPPISGTPMGAACSRGRRKAAPTTVSAARSPPTCW